jgi:hypothetical protein
LGWILAVVGLVHWLRTKRTWSNVLRRLLVGLFMFGVPVALVLVLQALSSKP